MANKLMDILNDDTKLKRLNTQLNEPTNQNSINVPKVVEPVKKKHNKTLGTSIINSPMFPSFLIGTCNYQYLT